jgi:nucleoredoxin
MKEAGKSIEIIFCSSDQDQAAFEAYWAEMPWAAAKFGGKDKELLSTKFGIRGIPSLIFVDGKTGEVVSKDGRALISEHGAAGFPFTAAHIEALVKEQTAKLDAVFQGFSCLGKGTTAILWGNAEDRGTQMVGPRMVEAEKELQGKCTMVYIPWESTDAEKEKAFAEELGDSFTLYELEEDAKKQIAELLKPDAPAVTVIGGDSKIVAKDVAQNLYQSGADGFPWNAEGMAAFQKKKVIEEEAAKKKAQQLLTKLKDLEAFDGAKIVGGEVEDIKKNEVVGLYFSAHWCGPCRGFTPRLAEFYKELKAAKKAFDIIFVSSDQNEAAFKEYHGEMPWPALDFSSQRELKTALSNAFGVRGIPSLVLLNPQTGEVITKEGRSCVAYGADAFPFGEEDRKRGAALAEERAAKLLAQAKEAETKLAEQMRASGQVALVNHRGRGTISADYTIKFTNFNTVVAPDVRITSGKAYYEMTLIKPATAQMGWHTEGFKASENPNGEGVGDDAFSWGYDGDRQQKWHSGSESFGASWKKGDVIGFAADMDKKELSFSVNGSFESPNGVAFTGIKADWLAPALTGYGEIQVNFGQAPLKHLPDGFTSIQDCLKK